MKLPSNYFSWMRPIEIPYIATWLRRTFIAHFYIKDSAEMFALQLPLFKHFCTYFIKILWAEGQKETSYSTESLTFERISNSLNSWLNLRIQVALLAKSRYSTRSAVVQMSDKWNTPFCYLLSFCPAYSLAEAFCDVMNKFCLTF